MDATKGEPKAEWMKKARKRAREDDLEWWSPERITTLALALEDYANDNKFRLDNWSE